MQTRTILNRIQKHKGFVYGVERWGPSDEPLSLLIPIRAAKRSRPSCSGCEQPGPGYDRLAERRFAFIPLWGIMIYFLYALRRVDCPTCGVRVEKVPWAQGKESLCLSYQWFLARWAKQLSYSQVAEAFCTSWESVFKSVQMAVYWGLLHRNLDAVEAIGVDEIAWHKNHKYLTLVYDIGVGSKRLLYIARDRTEQSLRGFFQMLGAAGCQRLRYVCSDMWGPYLKVIAEYAVQAVNILDRFHIIKKVVRTLRNHRDLILNWFAAQGTMSSGSVEGLNHKAKVVFRNAYGYREYNTVEIALYHTLGALPEPPFTHRFR